MLLDTMVIISESSSEMLDALKQQEKVNFWFTASILIYQELTEVSRVLGWTCLHAVIIIACQRI